MPETDPCEVCHSPARTIIGGFDGLEQECPRCGKFRISGTAYSILRHVERDLRFKLSGWIRYQNELGDLPVLGSDQIRQIVSLPLPRFAVRANRMLAMIERKQSMLGGSIPNQQPDMSAISFARNANELSFLQKYLRDQGFIETPAMNSINLTPKGIMHLEDLRAQSSSSTQAFVAMWFNDSMNSAYDSGILPAVHAAGYVAVRVDNIEHNGKIDDEIVAQIRKSRFLVADFTGHRAGVYFEAGLALGLNLPVIWTCKAEDIENLHFDIRQYNCINWRDVEDLKNRLRRRIEAVVGPGPDTPRNRQS